ncbi:Heparan-sulfate 6-O-sulfotransferase [Aphelenchoides fujianensis]|nr:Heparan-sulfate 6-O-sulfotransferase [Aphelenchoides fujianensis]
MAVLENRAKPSMRCGWPTIALLLVGSALFFFLLVYLIAGSAGEADGDFSSMSLTTRYSVEEMQKFALQNALSIQFKPSLYDRRSVSFNRLVSGRDPHFDVDGVDVLVFLHIQKTAGTSFEKFLVTHLNITRPCLCNDLTKRCRCSRPRNGQEFWLFSRYSTGWYCGLHADFTELYVSGCVEKAMDELEREHRVRRYFYTTFLRNPIERFISEYRHVERGANWLRARHVCNGRRPTATELPLCFDPSDGWKGVSLSEYLSCPFNLAFNRQTRMLADLSLVHCYDLEAMPRKNRDRILLASAKNNLRGMAFFGIKERMADSQEMFERLFQLKFTQSLAHWNKSKSADTVVSAAQMDLIREQNALDLELYEYAVRLFEKRLAAVRKNGTMEAEEAANLPAVLPSATSFPSNSTGSFVFGD